MTNRKREENAGEHFQPLVYRVNRVKPTTEKMREVKDNQPTAAN